MDVQEETEALQAARRQRRGLRSALVALESATASPSSDALWLAVVSERLLALRAAFAYHVEVTEGEGGLLEEAMELAPRLARRTKLVRDDHVAIHGAIASALEVVGSLADRDDDDDTDVVANVRAALTDVMGRIARHRQLGADLVHEVYSVDIEGGG